MGNKNKHNKRDQAKAFLKGFYDSLKKNLSLIFGGVIAGVIAQILFAYGTTIIQAIIIFVPIWGTLFIIPTIGIFFYWLRSRNRILYGFVEIIFGIVAAINVFLPIHFDYSKLEFPSAIFQVFGGIYVIVRGLDNFAHGIKNEQSKISWEKFFGKA